MFIFVPRLLGKGKSTRRKKKQYITILGSIKKEKKEKKDKKRPSYYRHVKSRFS